MTSSEQEIVDSAIKIAVKAAALAESWEKAARSLQAENDTLRVGKQAAQAPKKFSTESLLKMAKVLESEGLLQEGIDAEKAANLLQDNPDSLPDFVIRLVKPIEPEGHAVKTAAETTQQLPGGGKIIKLAGKELVDRFGFANLIPDLKS